MKRQSCIVFIGWHASHRVQSSPKHVIMKQRFSFVASKDHLNMMYWSVVGAAAAIDAVTESFVCVVKENSCRSYGSACLFSEKRHSIEYFSIPMRLVITHLNM